MTEDYGGKYLKIRKALHEAGFDEFHQAGSVSRFHKMNIVADSAILVKRFWFHIEGGYNVKDELYITSRDLASKDPCAITRTYCGSQQEMADQINAIRQKIEAAKGGD